MEYQLRKKLSGLINDIEKTDNIAQLEKVSLQIFGKKGIINNLAKQIANIPQKDRAKFGLTFNKLKKEISAKLIQKQNYFKKNKEQSYFDATIPVKDNIGHLHLISQAVDEIVNIFKYLGFSLVSYPEIDWDWYAFEALNMPYDHPARDDWETFFIKNITKTNLGNQVLTPHTSNGQVREMERLRIPPVRMLNISRCYRRQIDISHTPMFHQFEGLLIDKNISIGDLKGTLVFFTKNFFGPNRLTRLRPHHFRFTEPSFEVDIICGICLGKSCRFCKRGWVELGGAGMVHPKVLTNGGIDANIYSGFAFGWGIERTISMKVDLGDIRLLYQNDIRFLEQF